MLKRFFLFSYLLFSSLVFFGQDSLFHVKEFIITGNQTTHPSVILREFNFGEGDTLSLKTIISSSQKAEDNLKRTSLFNFAKVEWAQIDGTKDVLILVKVTERWYTWPAPIFSIEENNFNKWIREQNWRRTNVGFSLTQRNFRGRRESFSVKMQFGYLQDFGFTFTKPFFPKATKLGFGVGYNFQQRDEVRVGSEGNERIFLKIDQAIQSTQTIKFNLRWRPKTSSLHLLEMRLIKSEIQDTVRETRQNFFPNHAQEINYPTFYYLYSFDNRDNNYYPSKGHFFRGIFSQSGINRDQVFYQTVNLFSTHFYPIHDRLVYGLRNRWVKNFGKNIPYMELTGLGYDHFARGYELYNFDSPEGYFIQRNSMQWNWLKSKTGKLPFIRNEKFSKFHFSSYLSLFADWGYGWDKLEVNSLNNQFLGALGVGLNFVTYYDKVLRIEASRNKFGDFNVFLHFKKAI
ncbi:MAG: outer membrane protein assembly factor BamA [Sphingobacteriales bacterium]|jgi:outer membrane protein assembly factor BamA